MTYLATVLADNPSHYWRMADQGGRICHDIGSVTPEVILGCTAGEMLPYTGIALDGGSLACCGTLAQTPNASVHLPATGWSLECWFFASGLQGAAGGLHNQYALSLNDDQHGVFSRLWCQTDGKCGFDNTFGGQVLSATKPFQTWHHVVGAFNGTHTLVYVDGVFIGNDALAGLGAGDYRVMVGNNIGNLTEPLYGAVAECAVYQFGLSATQVANHFNAIEVAVTAPPLFQLGGVVGVGVGGTAPFSSLLNAILQSVRKTY